MRPLILIPAYNEELTIGSIVCLAKRHGDVLVVDDGSEDRTSEVAKVAGARVVRHELNRGKGEALKSGFRYALENGYDAVICLDADGQHDPDEIPRLLEPILRGEADLVVGSRFLAGAEVPLHRRLGLWILNAATRTAGPEVTDSQSGYRALNRRALEEGLKLSSEGYHAESEMLIRLAEGGLRIREVPVGVRYDVPRGHKAGPLSHGFSVLSRIVGFIGYRRPLLTFGAAGALSLLASGALAYWALRPYYGGGHVYLTQAIGAGIFAIIGIQLIVAGLTLNVLARMVRGR